MSDSLDYRSAGVDLAPTRRRWPGSPPDEPHVHTAGDRVEGRICRVVPARRQDRAAVADVSRPGAGRLDRRGWNQAEAGLRHGPAHHGRHRPGGDVGQRLPLRRGRAAALSRLRGDEPRRPCADGPDRQGISDGCLDAECALLGGETAILPEFYQPGEYDLAGFCVGVVERKQILKGQEIRVGDKVIGLASSGLHSNGYSLARKIVFDHAGLTRRPRRAAGPDRRRRIARADADLRAGRQAHSSPLPGQADRARHRPHHRRRPDRKPAANPARRLRHPAQARLVGRSPGLPLAPSSAVSDAEMFRVFNMGIGLVLIVAEYNADAITRYLNLMPRFPRGSSARWSRGTGRWSGSESRIHARQAQRLNLKSIGARPVLFQNKKSYNQRSVANLGPHFLRSKAS